MRWLALGAALACAGCLSPWPVTGPYACDASVCPHGLVCDDGVCCVPGGSPACPTLPSDAGCPGSAKATLLYLDADGDGAGNPATSRLFCAAPMKEHWVLRHDDCDDTSASISPTATERCNGLDDDCNGLIDDGLPSSRFFRDDDGDGYGDDCSTCQLAACAAPKGYVSRAGDCAPTDPARHPGAVERCNGVDDNCNGAVDDPPFSDVETPGTSNGLVFDCTPAGAQGLCAQGGLQCLFDPAVGRFQPTCVPRQSPQPEVCGDGVDNDCNGAVDDQPGCGGPRSLIDSPGTTVAALRFDLPDAGAGLPPTCLAGLPQARPMAWLNPSWVGSGGVARHVWALKAPAGLPWDLSRSTESLSLELTLPFWINPASGGWGDSSTFANPVITLCGLRDGEYLRFTPQPSTFNAIGRAVPWTVKLPLSNPPSGWKVENGPTPLDRHQVGSLELVVSPLQPSTGTVTFTLVVSPTAGFSP